MGKFFVVASCLAKVAEQCYFMDKVHMALSSQYWVISQIYSTVISLGDKWNHSKTSRFLLEQSISLYIYLDRI